MQWRTCPGRCAVGSRTSSRAKRRLARRPNSSLPPCTGVSGTTGTGVVRALSARLRFVQLYAHSAQHVPLYWSPSTAFSRILSCPRVWQRPSSSPQDHPGILTSESMPVHKLLCCWISYGRTAVQYLYLTADRTWPHISRAKTSARPGEAV